MVRVTLASFPAFRALLRRGRASLPVRWRERAHPQYVRAVEHATARPSDGLPNAELLDDAAALLDAGTTYYTAVQTIIPLAATSETTFTRFYERLVRRAGEPPAATFLLGFDSAPIRAEQSLYDLAAWTRTHPALSRCAARRVTGRHGRGDRRRRAACRSRRADVAGVVRPVPAAPGPARAHRLQPRFRGSGACGRPGARCSGRCGSTWTAAARTRTQRRQRARAAPRGGDDAGRGPAGPAAPGRVPPVAALGTGDGAAARRRPRRRRARLAAAAPDAPRARRAAGRRGRGGPGGRRVLAAPRGDPRGATGPARGGRGAAPGAVAGATAGRAAAGAAAGQLVGEGVRPLAARVVGRADGAVLRGIGASTGQVTATARVLGGPGRLRPPAAGRRAGRQHHHARRGRRCSRWRRRS